MDEATKKVAYELIEFMDSDPEAKTNSVQHSDWFNGLIDHLISFEKTV
jgi:hypothetical protein